MIVYVESNFILEIARLQEEAERCEALLAHAEAGAITVVVPAFSLAEPYHTLRQAELRREAVHDDLTRELRQLGRSRPYAEIVDKTAPLTGLLVSSNQEDKDRLDAVVKRVTDVARVVPLSSATIRRSLVLRTDRSLEAQDAVVYASVLDDLEVVDEAEEKCFPNRNVKDFLAPDIEEDLAAHRCKILPSFEDGLRYVEARI